MESSKINLILFFKNETLHKNIKNLVNIICLMIYDCIVTSLGNLQFGNYFKVFESYFYFTDVLYIRE